MEIYPLSDFPSKIALIILEIHTPRK
jgi:hypothetical protein